MNEPMIMFTLWVVGLVMGGVPAWIIAKATLPTNWFFHLNFARGGAPIVSAYPVKPNQQKITIREGGRKLQYPLLQGYGSPYARGTRTPKGTAYFGHAQSGTPVALKGSQENIQRDPETGTLLQWTWKADIIHPNAAEMAAAQDDDRELKLVQASRQSAKAGIPLMYLLIGGAVLAFMLFMR